MPYRSPEARREYHRRYYREHREQQLEARRTSYWANLEHERARSRIWRRSHPRYVWHYNLAYRAAHLEQMNDYNRRYRRTDHAGLMQRRRARYRELNDPVGTSPCRRSAYALEHPDRYVLDTLGIQLRPYQVEPLKRVLGSIKNHLGDTIILMFPRQSGKDELLLDLLLYLGDVYATEPAGIIFVNPTYKPQTETALQRFDAGMRANSLTRGKWHSHGGFMRSIGRAHISFLSGEPNANVTGATASLLLVVNEAQDILPQVYHQKFEPMAASMNATRILAGTAWTSQTLLAQEMRAALQAEKDDGRKRVFMIDAEDVRRVAPWYGNHVDAIVRAHGRQHPLVKTQYFNEEIDAEIGMFPPARRAMMQGDQIGQTSKVEGHTYVFCIDVAGQDETRSMSSAMQTRSSSNKLQAKINDQRDATTLSIVDVDLSTLSTLQAPTYRVVHRIQWTGLNHLSVFGKLKALADQWRPQHIVIDATGVGEGLWAMLDKAFPTRVLPVKFSSEKKSEMGYRFISIIETGRFRDAFSGQPSAFSRMADRQYTACQAEVLPGPRKTMRWGVPDGTRDENGELVHDDIVLADALITQVDALEWSVHSPTLIVQAKDPLDEMSRIHRSGEFWIGD